MWETDRDELSVCTERIYGMYCPVHATPRSDTSVSSSPDHEAFFIIPQA